MELERNVKNKMNGYEITNDEVVQRAKEERLILKIKIKKKWTPLKYRAYN